MADSKISQLTGGGAAQATDEYVVARAGGNNKITGANVAAAATSVGTLTSLTVSGTASVASAGTVTSGFVDGLIVAGWNALGYNPSVGNNLSVGGYRSSQWVGIDFYTSGSKKASLDTNGNLAVDTNTLYVDAANNRVGIGTASPGYPLDVQSAIGEVYVKSTTGTNYAAVQTSNTGGSFYAGLNNSAGNAFSTTAYSAILWHTGAYPMVFATSNAEKMRIDASGNLLVGATSSLYSSSGRVEVNINGTSQALLGFGVGGSGKGYIYSDGTNFFAMNSQNGYYSFGTNNTERARITSGGLFYLGTTTDIAASGNAMFQMSQANNNWIHYAQNSQASGNVFGHYIAFSGQAPNNTTSAFLLCGDTGADRLRIRSNGGIANYQANNVDLSDARTKTDITPAASMWDKVAALEIVTYKYVDQTHDDVNVGVIAQQVETVEPVWVDSDGFGDTPEGEEPFKTVYTKDITFAAIKALQEAMARIEALEARLEALEA